MRRTRSGSARDEPLGVGSQQVQHVIKGGGEVANEQDQPWQGSLQQCRSVGAIAPPRDAVQLGLMRGRGAQQRGQVVGQHLGGHVDEQRVLAQARYALELHPMFEPLEQRAGILPVNIPHVRS